MRILWTTIRVMPDAALAVGIAKGGTISWIEAMSKRLVERDDISLAIASPAKVKELKVCDSCGIRYYLFPRKRKGTGYWKQIVDDFQPDIIHAYGTEMPYNSDLLEAFPHIPCVVSLQGILTEYARHYYSGIPLGKMIRYTRPKDMILPTGFFSGKREFEKNAVYERNILKKATCVEGRSTWDKVAALKINPSLNYFYCPRMIRSPFYETDWDLTKVERHTIFVHQGDYPIKGLHFLIEALAMLRKRYPDVRLYVAGNDFFKVKGWKQRLLKKSYVNYIRGLIEQFNLWDHIVFTGYLSADTLADRLSRVNVSVLPSSIENAPNAIAESQLVGTPCVASFVGGNMDMMEHGTDGYLYCYDEPDMLCEYVSRIFDSDELALSFSSNSKKRASQRHEPESLIRQLISIYHSVADLYQNQK